MLFAMTQSILMLLMAFKGLILPAFSICVHWFGLTTTLGCILSIMELIFFRYWSTMWLKHIPSYDHDFIGLWLSLINIMISAYIGALHSYIAAQATMDKDVPKIKQIYSFILNFQFSIYILFQFQNSFCHCLYFNPRMYLLLAS